MSSKRNLGQFSVKKKKVDNNRIKKVLRFPLAESSCFPLAVSRLHLKILYFLRLLLPCRCMIHLLNPLRVTFFLRLQKYNKEMQNFPFHRWVERLYLLERAEFFISLTQMLPFIIYF